MILFILEGERREIKIFKTIARLFLDREDSVLVAFGGNIYNLYSNLKQLGEGSDVVELLRYRCKQRGDHVFDKINKSDAFSEIYLVFDYDFHDLKRPLDKLNSELDEMLDYFDDETGNGKLYINYPMIEALAYTKQLPDNQYNSYELSRTDCSDFKHLVHDFSYYPSFDFLMRGDDKTLTQNWVLLKQQNVSKANWICNGDAASDPGIDAISQKNIFKGQQQKYICSDSCRVSILAALPLFLYEWEGR